MNIAELKERHPRAFDVAYTTWREGEGNPDYNWYDSTLESAKERAIERGFYPEGRGTRHPDTGIYFSGFCSQGDGACWRGSVDIPKWIEWMRAQHNDGEPGNGTPFTDIQLLWLDEAYRNDLIEKYLTITTNDRHYSHSGVMSVMTGAFFSARYEDTVEEGIFSGMDMETFEKQFFAIVGNDVDDIVLKTAQKFADELYKELEEEFNYLTSEEYFIETKTNEGINYDEKGNETHDTRREEEATTEGETNGRE